MDPNARHDPDSPRSAATAALCVACATLAFDFATMSPGVHWYDSAEFAAKAIHLDIPHPPGYPLYIVVAHLFTWLPFEPAYSLNLLSVLCAAAATAFATLAAAEFGARPLAAATGGLLLGVSFTFWDNTNVAESYGPGIAFAAAVFWLLLRALRQGRPELATVAALVAGFGTGAHLAISTLGLGFVALVWFAGGATPAERMRSALRCGIGAGIAIAGIYLLIPLSRPERLGNLDHWRWSWMMMSGGTFWNYFDLPTPENPLLRAARMLANEIGAGGVALALAGFVWLGLRRARVGLAFALAIAGNVGFFLEFEAHDLEVFFLPSVLVLCLAAAAGAEAAALLAARIAPERSEVAGRIATLACLLVPLAVAFEHGPRVDKSDDTSAREFGERLVRSLPEHAVFVTFNSPDEWRLQSVWLYFQHGLGERPDVRTLSRVPPRVLLCYLDAGHAVYAYKRHPDLVKARFEIEQVAGQGVFRLHRSPEQGPASRRPTQAPGAELPDCR